MARTSPFTLGIMSLANTQGSPKQTGGARRPRLADFAVDIDSISASERERLALLFNGRPRKKAPSNLQKRLSLPLRDRIAQRNDL
jgi:hypothetical protein